MLYSGNPLSIHVGKTLEEPIKYLVTA